MYARFFHAMLSEGVALAPGAYEALFVGLGHTDAVIDAIGDIDWGRFVGELRRVGYDGPVCIEVEDDTFGRDLPGRLTALRVAGRILKPYFA